MSYLKNIFFVFGLVYSIESRALCGSEDGVVCPAFETSVKVGVKVVGHSTTRISDLFGIHSLFWGVQKSIVTFDGEVNSSAVTKLKEAGVSLVRNGGGVNEIDWTQCVGTMSQRRPQKVVRWADPMQCRFGLQEYEHLNDKLGTRASWHMANLVGLEFKTFDIQLMAASARGHAKAVHDASNGRKVYWELGNELVDGEQRWDAEIFSTRAAAVARSIRSIDSTVEFVVPLLSFRPSWVIDDVKFNQIIAENLKDYTSSFALHTYYDNPPEGPSVNNRLRRVSETAKMLRQKGFINPSIWVTEHSRWPKGSPAEQGWLRRWNQAANFDAALSTADYLIGLSQIPDVNGAMWHVLRGEDWSFLLIKAGQPILSPIGKLFSFLQPRANLEAIETTTYSPPSSFIENVPVIRASVLREINSSKLSNAVTVWVVNRSSEAIKLPIIIPFFEKFTSVTATLNVLEEGKFDSAIKGNMPIETVFTKSIKVGKGGLMLTEVPARSVVNMKILASR